MVQAANYSSWFALSVRRDALGNGNKQGVVANRERTVRTVYAKKARPMRILLSPVSRKTPKDILCMGPCGVWHEQKAWRRFLMSTRDCDAIYFGQVLRSGLGY